MPTPEDKPPALASVYALSKFDQERMCLMLGRAYGIPAVALRFFNTYGPYQALSNPYTGVLSNFASRVLNGNAAADLRRRLAEARFRQRLRRGARLPAGAGDARRRRAGIQHLERRADDREGSGGADGAGDRHAATSSRRSPASIAPATSGTALPISRWRARCWAGSRR